MREPEVVIEEVIDLSKRIDRLYGDVETEPEKLWMGRRTARPLGYEDARAIQRLKLKRKAAQADLPPLALVAR